jgi:hypothetical protein
LKQILRYAQNDGEAEESKRGPSSLRSLGMTTRTEARRDDSENRSEGRGGSEGEKL